MIEVIEGHAEEYARQLQTHTILNGLPNYWFDPGSADHLGYACFSATSYDRELAEIEPHAADIYEVATDNRQLAIVELAREILAKPFGLVTSIEIIKPNTANEGKRPAFVPYMGFWLPNIVDVVKDIHERDRKYEIARKGKDFKPRKTAEPIDYDIEYQDQYMGLVIPIVDGRMVKIVNQQLTHRKDALVAAGKAEPLKLNHQTTSRL